MRRLLALLAALSTVLVLPVPTASAEEQHQVSQAAVPRIAGWDTYRRLDLLPYLDQAAETKQYSSYARDGSNLDGGEFTCMANPDPGCLIAEDQGAGEISSIWSTRMLTDTVRGDVRESGRITIVLDGVTVVNANFQDVVDGKLGPPFVHPMVNNAHQSSGGVTIKVPMTYRTSMRVLVENNPRYYHVTYREFPDAEGVQTFNPADPATDARAVVAAWGTKDPKPPAPNAVTTTDTVTAAPSSSARVNLPPGPGLVRELRFTLPDRSDHRLSTLRLRLTFDGRRTVDAPFGEFFAAGLGAYDVKSLLFAVDAQNGVFTTWWPMPYQSTAQVELYNTSSTTAPQIKVEATTAADQQWQAALEPGGQAGYFTALSNAGDVVKDQDWVLADIAGRGKLVGVVQTMIGKTDLRDWLGRTYLEGDERVFVDGSPDPDLNGTGTEDFYEAGWYFWHGRLNGPWVGNPAFEHYSNGCTYQCDSTYRLMLGDSVHYRTALRFGMEHGFVNEVPATYGSTAFLYAQQSSATRRTDILEVGDPESRNAHAYTESGPAEQEDLTSRYEGDDPTGVTAPVRRGGGTISFKVAVDPGNQGVLVRRRFDQYVARQAVKVAVDGTPVGTWLRPDDNTFHRWGGDTFPLPASATAGKSSVTVSLTPAGERWNASSYLVDSVVPPALDSVSPNQPTIRATSVNTAVRLGWREPLDDVGVSKYHVYGSDNGTEWTRLGTTAKPLYADGPLPRGKVRHYRVVAEDFRGNKSAPSTALTVTVKRAMESDTNGDGKDDIVTANRAVADVFVSQSDGTTFVQDQWRWHDDLVSGTEVPLTGDFNGDGQADLASFARGTNPVVKVALAIDGQRYGEVRQWHGYFARDAEVPKVGDFNGDGMDDIVTFTRGGAGDVYVALSDGTKFGQTGWKWHEYFAINEEVPQVGDFNGDGMDDIATFTRAEKPLVYVSLSQGAGFGPSSVWHEYFATRGETPGVGDFDGDGRDDIVVFTQAEKPWVYVALSTGTGFKQSAVWHEYFATSGEVPGVGDFNGDGRDDIVTFTRGTSGWVYVALSNGGGFGTGDRWHRHFAFHDEIPLPGLP